MGGGTAKPRTERLGEALGRLIAAWGAVLLCGGGSGVMEAAARGAKWSDPPGATLGILPTLDGERAPNPHLDLAIFTGLRDARNYINVVTSDAIVALEGGPGTLSEIALALKVGTPVVCLDYWQFLVEADFEVHCVSAPDAAIERAFALIGCERGGTIASPVRFPDFPDQSSQRRRLVDFIEARGPLAR